MELKASFEVIEPVIPLPGRGVVFSVLMDVGVDYSASLVFGLLVGVGSGVSTDYEVGVPGYGLSDSGGVVLSDSWSYVFGGAFDLSDSVSAGLSDSWSYSFYALLSLADSAGLGLSDDYSSALYRLFDLAERSCLD